MRKRNLIFPLVLSSLFIPSLESIQSETFSNSFENENISYEAIDDIPLASTSGATGGGGGGGGGNSAKSKRKKAKLKKNQKKAKEAAKKRIIQSKIAAREPLTDEEKKLQLKK